MVFKPPVEIREFNKYVHKKLKRLSRNPNIKYQAERFFSEIEEGIQLPGRHFEHMWDNVWKAYLNDKFRIAFRVYGEDDVVTAIEIIEIGNHDQFYQALNK